jgi:hypothetical protein
MPSLAPFVTGLAFGDGGIERPSRGGPLPPGRAPGMAGRRRGAGDDMFCCSRGEGPLLIGCIYDMFLSQECCDSVMMLCQLAIAVFNVERLVPSILRQRLALNRK